MSIARWSYPVLGYPVWDPYSFSDERRTLVVPLSGRHEQRIRRDNRRYRSTQVTVKARTDAQRDAIDAFFVGLGFEADSFLVEDPRRNYVSGLALGTSIAAQVNFTLPTSGDYGGAYPLDDPNTILRSDGSPIAKTVNTDSRILVASVAPGAGHTMTADVYYWCRVVLRGRYRWSPLGEGAVWETSMTWEEVPE